MDFEAFGQYLTELRISKNVSQEEIAEWLDISQATVHRIEIGQILPRYSQYIILMEKFGEYADYSLALLLNSTERFGYDKLTELRVASIEDDVEQLRRLVNEVEGVKPFDNGVYLQYLRYIKIRIDKNMSDEDAIAELTDILRMTNKKFDESTIAEHRLRNDEIVFIDEMASRYNKIGDKQRSLDILLAVKESMDKYYVSEREKAFAYPTILDHIAMRYGQMGDHMKVLDYSEPARRMAIKYGRYRILPDLQYNIANVRFHQGDMESCRALVTEAYYTARAMEQFRLANYIKKDAEEDFGIIL